MNAALGFDTFMIVRHGLKSTSTDSFAMEQDWSYSTLQEGIHGSQLGCYFCNDVVAPGNVRLIR